MSNSFTFSLQSTDGFFEQRSIQFHSSACIGWYDDELERIRENVEFICFSLHINGCCDLLSGDILIRSIHELTFDNKVEATDLLYLRVFSFRVCQNADQNRTDFHSGYNQLRVDERDIEKCNGLNVIR